MRNSVLLSLVLVTAMIGGAGLFYLSSKLPDNDLINRDVNAQLLQIDGLNSSMNELVLRSRANLDLNYDMLVRSTVALERAVGDLSEGHFHSAAIAGSLLEKRFDSFRDSVEIKLDHIESFKSSNAVLRNSENYTPQVGEELVAIANEQSLPGIVSLFNQVVVDVLAFSKMGSTKGIELVQGHPENIRSTLSSLPEESAIKVMEFANHVATVIDSKQKTDSYLSQILNSSTDDQIAQISNAWGVWQSSNNNTQQVLNYYVIAYVLTMLALIGLLAFRLRNMYRSLDEQVEEKTAEVKSAYQELHDSERKLVQTEKMASLGQLVAGVAHEINTPLSYISSNMDTIKNRFDLLEPVIQRVDSVTRALTDPSRDNKTVSELLRQQILAYRKVGKNNTPENTKLLIQDASQGLQEIKGIVDSLTTFSHVQDAPAEEIDINEAVRKALKMTEKQLEGRKVMINLANQLPKVEGMSSQLIQVFTNIITNASHATSVDSGVLTVKTRLINGAVIVMFKDNGQGMDEEALSKAFDPFYTTKEVGEGTGLGLSISYRIVETHGGKLSMDSQLGVGTTVVVELPL